MKKASLEKLPVNYSERTFTKEETTSKKIILADLKILIARTITLYSVTEDIFSKRIISKEAINSREDIREFPLEEISEEEISSLRTNGIPAFLLKAYGKYLYTKIPRGVSFLGINLIGLHQCAMAGRECTKLAYGGEVCDKVRDFPEEKALEKYPFVIVGYETLNTSTYKCFVVVKCDHYEKLKIKTTTPQEKMLAREALNDYLEDLK